MPVIVVSDRPARPKRSVALPSHRRPRQRYYSGHSCGRQRSWAARSFVTRPPSLPSNYPRSCRCSPRCTPRSPRRVYKCTFAFAPIAGPWTSSTASVPVVGSASGAVYSAAPVAVVCQDSRSSRGTAPGPSHGPTSGSNFPSCRCSGS